MRAAAALGRASIEDRLKATPAPDLLAGAALSALCLAALIVCTDIKTEGTVLYADPGWDRHLYRLMAEEGLFEFRLAPYCWRILVPALAGWSPANLQASFLTITLLSLWGTGTVLYRIVRGRGQSVTNALAGVLLFYSLGWGAKFILADFWIPDGFALLFVTLALWAALEKHLIAFAAALLVGVLAKESVLLAAPLYLCLNWRPDADRHFVLTAVAAALPAVAAVAALRIALPHQNGDAAYLASLPGSISRFPDLYDSYNYWTLFHEVGIDQRWRARDFETLLDYTVRPFGLAMPVLVLFALRPARALALGLLPSLVLTYAQLLVATDTQRLIVMFSPCLVVLAMEGARELETTFGARSGVVLLFGLAAFLAALVGRQTYEVALGVQSALLLGGAAALFLTRTPPPREGAAATS